MSGQAITQSRKSLGGEYQWWTSTWNGGSFAPTNLFINETFKVGSGRMLVPAYRALGWTGSSGPDAVSHFASLKLSYESKYVLGFSKLYTWLNLQQWFNTGKEGKGLDAHEEDAEPALAAAGYQGQQAEGEHTLQGQKWNVLSKLLTTSAVQCTRRLRLFTYFFRNSYYLWSLWTENDSF